MRHLLLFILLLFSWSLALAQDEAAPTSPSDEGQTAQPETAQPISDAASTTFEDYLAEGFGFSIPVPTQGELQTPGGFGWVHEPEVAFVWQGGAGDPVSRIELRVDNIGTDISPEQYDEFYETFVSKWENQPNQFTVLRSRTDPFRFGEMEWLIIEVEDNTAVVADNGTPDGANEQTGAAQTVYYTIFLTKNGEFIYTIGFFYRNPVSEAVQELAVPMLRGFSVIE